MIKVAVYGSLKQGYGNHSLLSRSTCLGATTTKEKYAMYSLGGFPGVVKTPLTPVVVELYEVDEDTLQRLDWLEGHPDFYKRELITTSNGQEAWMYIYQSDCSNKQSIDSGCW